MRFLAFVTALLLFPIALSAQAGAGPGPAQGVGVIRGAVVSAETLAPLPSVSVTVWSAPDSAVVAGELTGSNGRFQLRGLSPGQYQVRATLLGHRPFSTDELSITAARPVIELDTIRLRVAAITLEGVVAEGERSSVVVAPDRTIYSTRDMPVASGGIATDVLRSVPDLEVDVDGNVSLRGSGAQIFLNGRPAPMDGEALQQFLQQLPADRIDRVEVIANPSARFQAEGAAGIVNIVLKKDVELGLSGSLFLNAGTRGDAGTGGRLTFQRGPLTLFGGGFLRLSRRDNTSYDFRENLVARPITFLEQDARSSQQGSFGNVDLTAELKLGPRSMIFSEVRVFRRGSASEGVTAYTLLDAARDTTERYDRLSDGESSSFSTDLVAGFRHVIEPRRHELELEVRYDGGADLEDDLVRRRWIAPSGEDIALPVELTTQNEDGEEREISAELNYVHPWSSEGQIEIGYRGDFDSIENQRLLQIFPDTGAVAPVSSLARDFSHRETFHSVYLTVARKLGPLAIHGGIRAERADTRLEIPGTGEQFGNDYGSIFPNAHLSYDLDDARQIRLSYSRRIRRPRESFLNPIDLSTDPLNRRVGNPYLRPQYTDNVSLEMSWTGTAGTLRFSPYYRQTQDDWAQFKTVDAAGVSVVSWENLASVEAYGTSLMASLRRVGGISGFASVSGYREVRDASNLAPEYSGSSMRWSARGNLAAELTPALSLQGMLYYTPARDVPQGRISSSLMSHFGLRQQLWGRKASLNLTFTDPFDLYSSSFETRDRTHVQTGSSRWSARSATLSFSYTFGRPPRDGREEESEEQAPPIQIR